jgi:hypothetical protein
VTSDGRRRIGRSGLLLSAAAGAVVALAVSVALSGSSRHWNNDDLRALAALHGNNFEAVDTSGLHVDPNSGKAR